MSRRGLGGIGKLAGGLGLVGALIPAGVWWFAGTHTRPAGTSKAATAARGPVSFDEKSPLTDLASGVRQGDGRALVLLQAKMAPPAGGAPKPVADEEGPDLVDALVGMRGGLAKFAPKGKVAIQEAAFQTLKRFGAEPAPAGWSKVLVPVFDILSAGLADPALAVRVSALEKIGRMWTWTPGCDMSPAEEKQLASCMEGFHPQVVRRLADAEQESRIAAIECLAALPIDGAAAPAIAYLNDSSPLVRSRVLHAFAARRSLLTEEAILPLLHDRFAELAQYAEGVLRLRGLTPDQIGLGRMITHPRPEMRSSAIPMLVRRSDIDPEVWLLFLTNDKDESVRLQAVQALTGRITPEVQQRLREMAAADSSPAVRAAARKLAPLDSTVALPPLPGSPSLTPKAN